ncbi:hypothetical protein [Acetomicrobium sp.]|uniref:hypothetical protein n=1 Tax=Acetomicrobium sp. TaxID=1872099 RepID=UPI002FCB11C6
MKVDVEKGSTSVGNVVPASEIYKEVIRLTYGQDCQGELKQVSLGHEFVTDVLQLQFHPVPQNKVDPVWFTSLACVRLVQKVQPKC